MTKKQSTTIRKQTAVLTTVALLVCGSTLLFAYSKRLYNAGLDQGLATSAVLGTAKQTVTNGVVEISVGNIEQAMTIPAVYEVDNDTVPVCVDVSIRNTSGSEKLFIPLEEIKLQDTQSNNSYAIAGVLTCAPGVGGPMQTGEVLHGKLGFLLPKSHGKLQLLYNPLDKNTKSFIITNI